MKDELEDLKYPLGRFHRPERFGEEMHGRWITEIEALPTWIELSVENLDSAQLEMPYRPGGWSVVQLVHHVADSHMNAYIRLKLAITENNPVIKPYEQTLWAQTPEVYNIPLNVSLTLLHALHRKWVSILKNLTEEDWNKTVMHPEQMRNIPVWELTALYAWHGRHHVAHIRQWRERNNWN